MHQIANPILNGLQGVGNFSSTLVVNFTKSLNDVVGGPGVDAFMDSAQGMGHRILHGHSLEYLPAIYQKFGWSGVGDGIIHWFRDFCSPHGVPVPFANEIKNSIGITPGQSIDWLCLNIGDVIGGSLSVVHSIHSISVMKAAVAGSYLAPTTAISIFIGASIKIGTSIYSGNIISFGSGVFDVCALGWALVPALSLGKSYFVARSIDTTAIISGAFFGAATGWVSTELVSKLMNLKERGLSRKYDGVIGGVLGAAAGTITGIWTTSKAAAITAASSVSLSWMSGAAYYRSKQKSDSKCWIDSIPIFLRPNSI